VEYRVEKMSDIFIKHHMDHNLVFHQMLGPDVGDPHDHPWSFETTILRGGYAEEIYFPNSGGRGWSMTVAHRRPGDRFRVDARTIHRIIDLPEGECWTMVTPQPAEREWKYWRFDEFGARSRHWWEPEFNEMERVA
jgi:hypothetical protein